MAGVSQKIKELREEAGLSQDELAQKVDMSRVSIGNYERGIRTPDANSIIKIAAFFNVSADYILGLSETKRLENDDINKRLGLSDKAIYALEELHKNDPGNSLTMAVNALLENQAVLWEIGRRLAAYESSGMSPEEVHKLVKVLKQARESLQAAWEDDGSTTVGKQMLEIIKAIDALMGGKEDE